jgi:hypothetical protein
MPFCTFCGSKIETLTSSCLKCESDRRVGREHLKVKYNPKTSTIVVALSGFLIVVWIVLSLNHNDQPLVTNSQSNTSSGASTSPRAAENSKKQPITNDERNYFGAAGSYLQTANAQGMNLARTMAGASNGSSTLDDIRIAILSAKRIENVAYLSDYKNRINGNVPTSVIDIAANVDETHHLFQSALDETLEYWNDQNTAHIISGNDALQRSVMLMNSTIAQTTETMGQFTAK